MQNLLLSSLLSKYTKIKIYRTIILPVVLYGCKTWSLTFREGFRAKVCENRVLKRIFGPEVDKVTGEWMRIHNELNVLYCSPNILGDQIEKNGMGEAYSVHSERRVVYRLLVGKREGKGPL